jgi:hypothetical protein
MPDKSQSLHLVFDPIEKFGPDTGPTAPQVLENLVNKHVLITNTLIVGLDDQVRGRFT